MEGESVGGGKGWKRKGLEWKRGWRRKRKKRGGGGGGKNQRAKRKK